MGFRSFARDIIVFYLVYEVIRGYFQGLQISSSIFVASILLLILTLWFLLEKIGILPSLSGE
ncbi:MAG: hypothetical protein QXQ69_03015 [Candidatus Aenigmatarchaeota archaeon]